MTIETFFGSDKFNFFQTITPYRGFKKGLLIYRMVIFVILCYGLYGSIYVTIHHNPHQDRDWIWFAYFTNQTYVAIMIYFLMGIINYFRDAKGLLKGRANSTFIHVLAHIFYNILFPLAFIVTMVFWGLMFPSMETFYFTFTHWSQEIIQHLLQTFMVGIDWFLITVPTTYAHFIPMFIVGVAYLTFAQIYHVIYNVWIYKFLDPSGNKYWYLLYIGLVIVWSALGFVFAALQKLKNRKRKFIGGSESCRTDDYELA